MKAHSRCPGWITVNGLKKNIFRNSVVPSRQDNPVFSGIDFSVRILDFKINFNFSFSKIKNQAYWFSCKRSQVQSSPFRVAYPLLTFTDPEPFL